MVEDLWGYDMIWYGVWGVGWVGVLGLEWDMVGVDLFGGRVVVGVVDVRVGGEIGEGFEELEKGIGDGGGLVWDMILI